MRIEIDIDGNITEHEDAPINHITLEQAKATKLVEAIAYLVSTDYMMTSDYDKDTTEVRILRQQARDTIRGV